MNDMIITPEIYSSQFEFDNEGFNRLFPFYILVGKDLKILSFGTSIRKYFPSLSAGEPFHGIFSVGTTTDECLPDISDPLLKNQLILIKCNANTELVLRGQLEPLGDKTLFVGSPWLVSLDDITKRNLSLFDFAHHDPQLDLLQLMHTYEHTSSELQEQLRINTLQKEQLREQNEELNKLSVVASANENAIVFTHPDARIFWCNDAYIKLTGYSRDEVYGKTPVEIGRTQETEAEAITLMLQKFYNKESFDVEITHGRKDGSCFWSRTKGQPIYDAEGQLTQYFAMIEDKTLQKEQEEQLILLSLIARNNLNAVVICDKNGAIEWVNPSFCNMTGYDYLELIGKKPGPLLQGPESDPVTVKYIAEQLKNGATFECELINYHKNGSKYWVKIQGRALYNKWGEVTRYFALEEDITQKKEMEAQREELLASLAKSNRELEDYAQVVSHDLKSPLRSINSLMAWIKEDNVGKLGSETLNYLDLIDDKLEKMDHLIDGILTYSRIDKGGVATEDVDIAALIHGIASIIHNPANVEITAAPGLPVIRADRFRMQQLFQNLISNAVNYNNKSNGKVHIGYQDEGNYHVFSIADNGPGIARENHEKIFKMFQSLTNHERSTGIGLSIVKKVVETYKGTITIESEPDIGTTFFVKFRKTI